MSTVAASLIPLLALGQVANSTAERGSDVRCGAYCLQVALKAIGYAPEEYGTLEKALGPPGPLGYSLAQLSNEARRRGAETLAVETSLENLRSREEAFACITLLGAKHFVLLFDADEAKVSIVDPPRAYTLPIETFRHSWTGKSLLISRQPLQAEEALRPRRVPFLSTLAWALIIFTIGFAGYHGGRWALRCIRPGRLAASGVVLIAPGILGLFEAGCTPVAGHSERGQPPPSAAPPSIQVDPDIHRIGDVLRERPGATLDLKTTVRNRGGGTLIISSIGTSCGCTKVHIDRDKLGPGETSKLTARLELGDSTEYRRAYLTLDSNDVARPRSTVHFEWRAKNPLRAAPETGFGKELSPGQEATFQVDLFLKGVSLCKECQVLAAPDSTLLSAESLAGDRGGLPDSHDNKSGSEAKIGSFLIRIRGGEDSSLFHQNILYRILCNGEERARLIWPVSWSVRPVVELAPSRVYLGLRRPRERISSQVRVKSSENRPFRILSVRPAVGGLPVHARFRRETLVDHPLEITVTLPGHSSGPWRVPLQIETDHEGAHNLELPVSAVITSEHPDP
jgi:hypothetical protein